MVTKYSAFALKDARKCKQKSQEYMALEMGVSRKTIQNWESGASSPSIDQCILWFEILELSPLPYLFQFVHPNMENISPKEKVEELRYALSQLIDAIPEEGVRQLLYLFYGDHGSSPRAVLNMLTAHLQSPMHSRVSNGKLILENYEMAKARNELSDINHVQPNLQFLTDCIEKGKGAAIKGDNTYFKHELETTSQRSSKLLG